MAIKKTIAEFRRRSRSSARCSTKLMRAPSTAERSFSSGMVRVWALGFADGLSSRFAATTTYLFRLGLLGSWQRRWLARARRQQIALRKTLGGIRAIARETGDGRRHPWQPHPIGGRRLSIEP